MGWPWAAVGAAGRRVALSGPETSQTLSRGLRVLETLAETAEERTPSELARVVGLPRPVLYRLLATLEAHRLVRRGPAGGYVVALGALELGRNALPALGMDAHAVLRRLAEETGAAAHLAVAEGDESVAVAVVEPRTATYHLAYRVGSRLPVTQGALGRAILAARLDRSELCTSSGEVIPGTSGAALPVLGLGLAAAVGVVAPHDLDLAVVAPALEAAAGRLSAYMSVA
ncbi:MAG TPA: helix-turn-helix domain-containing protein [Lapillicoccus sp.]|nr:helix-turn-helix domain-containing protein [Lapillicoccus sp.]